MCITLYNIYTIIYYCSMYTIITHNVHCFQVYAGICMYMHVYLCMYTNIWSYISISLYNIYYIVDTFYIYIYVFNLCVYMCLCVYSDITFLVLPLERNLWLVQLKQYYLFLGQTEIFFFLVLFLFSYICLLCIISFLFQGFYLQRYFSLSLYTCSSFPLIVFFICEVSKEALCPANNLLQTASCLLFLPTL